jgi:hypothetical protein
LFGFCATCHPETLRHATPCWLLAIGPLHSHTINNTTAEVSLHSLIIPIHEITPEVLRLSHTFKRLCRTDSDATEMAINYHKTYNVYSLHPSYAKHPFLRPHQRAIADPGTNDLPTLPLRVANPDHALILQKHPVVESNMS